MNTISHYKKSISNIVDKTPTKKTYSSPKISIKEEISDQSMEIDDISYEKDGTKLMMPESTITNRVSYNIKSILETDMTRVPSNVKRMAFCIYRINNTNNNTPFLEYLLYKYDNTKNDFSNMLIFPFVNIKTNIEEESNKFMKNLTDNNITPLGFKMDDGVLYMFYDLTSFYLKNYSKKYKEKNDKLWWCLIDEICNHQTVLNYSIHKSVVSMFFSNKNMIYLNNENGNIETPCVAYFGNTMELLPMIATFGLEGENTLNKNNILHFTGLKKSFRNGGWSKNYKIQYLYGKEISDIDGRYDNGGIIRFALFLGKSDILINKSHESLVKYINDGLWKKKYDSILFSSINFDNTKINSDTEYILKNNENQIPLSYHIIDKNTLPPTWDINHEKYDIE